MGAYGIKAIHPSDAEHILGFASARTTTDDALLELWNGSTSATRRFRVNKDGQIQGEEGTAAAPTYSFEGDLDSGWYRAGADAVSLALNGAAVIAATTAGVAVTGTLSSSGAATLASLGVTGAATVGSTLGVTGAVTAASLALSGAITGATTGAFSSNVTVGGTLGVTGATTLGTATITTANITALGAALNAASFAITNANIDSGTIDGTVIGGSTAAAGSFTTITSSGNTEVGGALVGSTANGYLQFYGDAGAANGLTLLDSGAVTFAGAVSGITTLGSSGAATLDTGGSGSSFGGNLSVGTYLTVSGSAAEVIIDGTGGTVNKRRFGIGVSGQALGVYARNDAGAFVRTIATFDHDGPVTFAGAVSGITTLTTTSTITAGGVFNTTGTGYRISGNDILYKNPGTAALEIYPTDGARLGIAMTTGATGTNTYRADSHQFQTGAGASTVTIAAGAVSGITTLGSSGAASLASGGGGSSFGGSLQVGGASGAYNFRVVGAGTADRLRVYNYAAGSGVEIGAVNAAEGATAPLNFSGSAYSFASGAVTFAGAVSGITTLTMTGSGLAFNHAVSANTATYHSLTVNSAAGRLIWGVEGAAGGLIGGTSANDAWIGSNAAHNFHLLANGSIAVTIAASGALTTTSDATIGNQIYLSNNKAILARNVGNTAHRSLIYLDTSDIIQIDGNALGVNFSGNATIGGALDHDGSTLGVFATAPTTKQTVTGSRGSNAALASLLTALAAYGLVTDSTSA